jgi:hypothetical protein
MQPHNSAPPTGSKPSKTNTLRYVVAVALLVLIVGGVAWVVQYLPGRQKRVDIKVPLPEKKLLTFERPIAQWGEKGLIASKDGSPNLTEAFPVKDVELGTQGHYDFLFKNTSGHEVEIIFFASTCDCTSVKAGALSNSEWERVNQAQKEKPGDPIAYAQEPTWAALPKKYTSDKSTTPMLTVKPDEGGVIRVDWNANKAAGQMLKVHPLILFQARGDLNLRGIQELNLPIMIRHAIQFQPPRLEMGTLSPGKTAEKKFLAWSTTRSTVDFNLNTLPPDPLFVFKVEPLTTAEFADLKSELSEKKVARPLCGYRVHLTAYESKDGKVLDQGFFYRKCDFALDGKQPDPNSTIYGPEIVGQVKGDIQIGGSDDAGKVRFPSINIAKTGVSKEVQLATDAKVELEKFEGHPHQPSWIKVNLTREEMQASKSRITWQLEVTVEQNALGARPFEEPDAVVLRIVGTDRFMRIPIEGHISR